MLRFILNFLYALTTNFEITCSTDDTAMLWGVKYYNDMLMEAGPMGNVQYELLFHKYMHTFTFKQRMQVREERHLLVKMIKFL